MYKKKKQAHTSKHTMMSGLPHLVKNVLLSPAIPFIRLDRKDGRVGEERKKEVNRGWRGKRQKQKG